MPWKVACHSIFLPYFLCLVAVLPRCLCCYHVLHEAFSEQKKKPDRIASHTEGGDLGNIFALFVRKILH